MLFEHRANEVNGRANVGCEYELIRSRLCIIQQIRQRFVARLLCNSDDKTYASCARNWLKRFRTVVRLT